MNIMQIKTRLILSVLGVVLTSQSSQACCRTDLVDRSPNEVIEKSLRLANEGDYSHVTGAVLVGTEEDYLSETGKFDRYGSAIAVDRYTILTCAHYLMNGVEPQELRFTLHPNITDANAKYYSISEVFLHPTYGDFPSSCNDSTLTFKGEITQPYINGFPLKGLTYPEIDQGPLNSLRGFMGIDLTILKLKEPLPENLIFPDILPQDFEITDTNAISLGYGRMFYNDQNQGPIRVINNQRDSIIRHLISSKVTAYTSVNKGSILYGNYTALLINREPSFLPDSTMLKTEGFPVKGDSGGPLFIKHDGKYKLVGILSNIWSPMGDGPFTPDIKEYLQKFGYTQPIFPVWADIRTCMEQVRSLMGPTDMS